MGAGLGGSVGVLLPFGQCDDVLRYFSRSRSTCREESGWDPSPARSHGFSLGVGRPHPNGPSAALVSRVLLGARRKLDV